MIKKLIVLILLISPLLSCSNEPWNSPYPSADATANTYYSSFNEPPKTLDPAQSYSVNETQLIAQTYEPPLQYDYLKRPYTLIPLSASQMPQIKRIKNKIVYTIQIKPGIFYQPHPAFAKDKNGNYINQNLSSEKIKSIKTLQDFKITGTRELTADDFVYEIKRLADPNVQSPIYSLMQEHILGFKEFNTAVKNARTKLRPDEYLDLEILPLEGAKALDRYTFQIILRDNYPQFIYWLTMPFFAPIPWEVDKFYQQPGMKERNITLAWYPVGTGPYYLIENNPNRAIVMEKNPNFHEEYFPSDGTLQDQQAGYLQLAGQRLPFISRLVLSLEKETLPRWNKFLQGYYDQSTISVDNFDQALRIEKNGEAKLTPEMLNKGIKLQVSSEPSIFYFGFNMLDPVVGGDSERARKLRQAITIIFNTEELIHIFLNGRGVPANGPLPPGVFGYRGGEEGLDAYIYDWQNRPIRKSLVEAKKWLAEAGYPNGIDPATHAPLVLNFDVPTTGDPQQLALLAWLQKQFSALGIHLYIRDTLYNRFQDKLHHGDAQIFGWGWVADYPDPENFFMLFYGPNSMAHAGGENAANYNNPEYDRLFLQMKSLPNNDERLALIDKMIDLLRHDRPWIWGYFPQRYALNQAWVYPYKVHQVAYNTLKYMKIDPKLRAAQRMKWNSPVLWPIGIFVLIILVSFIPMLLLYRKRLNQTILPPKD